MKKDKIIIITALFAVFIAALLTARYYSDSRLLGSTKSSYNGVIPTDGRLNINSATKEELSMLPGIGDSLSERIIEYREKNGPFENITDLTKVKGIGTKLLESIRQYITVDN